MLNIFLQIFKYSNILLPPKVPIWSLEFRERNFCGYISIVLALKGWHQREVSYFLFPWAQLMRFTCSDWALWWMEEGEEKRNQCQLLPRVSLANISYFGSAGGYKKLQSENLSVKRRGYPTFHKLFGILFIYYPLFCFEEFCFEFTKICPKTCLGIKTPILEEEKKQSLFVWPIWQNLRSYLRSDHIALARVTS